MKPTSLNHAAKILDGIRNDRTSTVQEMIQQVDAVGFWLAEQKKATGLTAKLLDECHSLYEELNDRPTHCGIRISI
jgi:hypothetical protein